MMQRKLWGLVLAVGVSIGVVAACASPKDRTRGKPIDIASNFQFATSPSGRALKLDLYTPKGFEARTGQRLPVVVWIHGGSWARGSEDRANLSAVALAAEGVAVASISYSLAHEANFPVQLGEVRQALVWLDDNATKLGLDMDRMGIWGGSAGGQLALMAGLAYELEAGPKDWPRPRFIVNLFGVTDFPNLVEDCEAMENCADRFGWGERTVANYIVCKAEAPACQETARKASPVAWIDASDPPVLTQHGALDNVVPPGQAKRLHQMLRKAGVQSQLSIIPDRKHGRLGQKAADEAMAYTRKHLGLTTDK
ncbi:MAG: hypothetical protein Alpg2KO_05590 [Alphaproteobacteria bacterium]